MSVPPSVAPPRDAATVVLLRDPGDGGPPVVLLLRRSSRTAFAPSAWVFPGGAVDPGDHRGAAGRWTGADPTTLGRVLGHPPALALALAVAAVRETFEEAGVLLARTASGARVPPEDPALVGLRAGEDLWSGLADLGWVLDLGALVPLSRWCTPRQEGRRYDTVFFMATVPRRQQAVPDHAETTWARWWRASEALAAHARGELPLMYPTEQTLRALQGWGTAAAALAGAAAQPALRVLRPHLERDADGRVVRVVHPDDPQHPDHAAHEPHRAADRR